MPDLTLTEDHKQYQDLAREFAGKEIAPRASEFDKTSSFPLEICQKAWEIGLVNVQMPEQLGGLGLGVFDACVIAEEIGAACSGIGAALWGNDLAVAPLLVCGSAQQKKDWLEPCAGHFGLAAYCFQESEILCQSSAGEFHLSGTATAINAKHSKWMFLTAFDQKSNTSTAFALPTDIDGVTVGERLPAIGIKAADIRHVQLRNVAVAAEMIVGMEHDAAAVLSRARSVSYPVLGSYAAGIIRSALQHSIRYAGERHTMGVPIANHQAVAFMLADMAKDLEASRFMLRKAAWLADQAQPQLSMSLMAKTFACDAAMKATTDGVQVFGGYGYSREYPVEKLMRDAKALQIYEYAAVQNKIDIARQLVAIR